MTISAPVTIPASIFKAYDIRGVVDDTLTADSVRMIGQAIGSLARERGEKAAVIGRDGRLSGPTLSAALAEGLRAAGVDVIDIGMVATPMVYFATQILGTGTGVMVTGSHNPPDYNGLKMVIAGVAIHGDTIQSLRNRIIDGNLMTGAGGYRTDDVARRYIDRIVGDVKLARPMKVAIDAGNGVAGAFAPQLLAALGCEVTPLFCEVDGTFPNHHPDPAHPENLVDLIKTLRATDCEIGLAFDGDGDRLGVVTKQGNIIWPDRQMILFATDVLSRNPGAEIIYDVKCTRLLGEAIRQAGGKPLMWRTGHSLVKAKLKETGAPLAGEMSGHIFFKERWYGFDDGMYAAARLLEIVSRSADPTAVLEALPNSSSTPELQIKLAEGENIRFVDALKALPFDQQFQGARDCVTIDGLRVEYADGFGLARPSNTTPVVVMRFEADTPEALARIQAQFAVAIERVRPGTALPF